jgi:3'-phosphoadenosine 5'-phosphosulfate sulfotransferase (PAPS reductase)/FAD synthetase
MVTIPDDVDAAASEKAKEVLDRGGGADKTLALVSGGHDSLTAMHLAYQSDTVELDGIVHIDTGVGVPETREFVRDRVDSLDVTYYEIGPEDRYKTESYEHLVHTLGFPGPPLHKDMYWNLKEKPLQRFLRQFEGDITLITGVSRHESTRRMENVPQSGVGEYLGYRTLSPIVEFRGIDVRRYRQGLDLPMNPVVEKLEMSGECLCGAFSGRGEKRMLRLFYPDVYRYLQCLEASVSAASYLDDGPDREYTEWGHGRLNDHERNARVDDEQMLLCAACEQDCERQN